MVCLNFVTLLFNPLMLEHYTMQGCFFFLSPPGGLRGVARGGLTGLTLTSLYALYNNWEHMKGSLLQQSLWKFCQLVNGGHFSSYPDQFISQSGVILSSAYN